jgi:ribosome recycling factor
MTNEIIQKADDKMKKSIENLRKELTGIRTGRANSALVENIHVDYYGSLMPLKQLASISTPESRQIMIQPFDKGAVSEIDKALQKADLGAMPKVDGTVIRVILPQMTEERRKDLVKGIKKYLEETKVSVRNIRREIMDEAKKKKEKKELTEDQEKHLETEIQKITDREIQEAEKLITLKEKEIMEV